MRAFPTPTSNVAKSVMDRKESLSWEPKATENDACGSRAQRTGSEPVSELPGFFLEAFTMSFQRDFPVIRV